MASSFSTDTKLELIATGEKAGLWGTITNTNLQILEQSATGYLSQSMASGDVTLTLTNGATSDGKNAFYGDRNHIHHLLIRKYSLVFSNITLLTLSIFPIALLTLLNLSFFVTFGIFLIIYIILIKFLKLNVK